MGDNASLRRYLDQSGWTPERLAREINRSYGAGTVSVKAPYGWLKGSFPRGRIPELVAEVLTEHLDRLVRVEDVWPGRRDRADTRSLTRLGIDLDWNLGPEPGAAEKRPEQAATEPDAAVPGPSVASAVADWLVSDGAMAQARDGGRWLPRAAGQAVLRRSAELRHCSADPAIDTGLLMDWLRNDLTWASSLVRDCSYDAVTGRSVFRALAELGELAGRLTSEADPVAAQRFLLLALRAADAGDDRALGCHLVWCLADVLVRLDEAEHAALLIRLALTGAVEEPTGGRSWVGRPDAVLARLRDDELCGSALSARTPA